MRTLALLLLAVSALNAQHVTCRTNYYTVTGNTLREIQHSLRQARPWKARAGHDGETVWNVSWRYSATPYGALCRLTTFTTTATINITLPRWIAATNVSDEVKTNWNRYIQALGQHEYGHAQFALAAAGEMHKRIKEVREDSNCEGLKQRVNALCDGIVQNHRQMEVTYDQRTDHGATQGARLWRAPQIDRPRPNP